MTTAFKVPFVGANLDGMGLGAAFRRFVLEDPDLLARFPRGNPSHMFNQDHLWPLSRSEPRVDQASFVRLNFLCNAFGDLFRGGECAARGHFVNTADEFLNQEDISAECWRRKNFSLYDLNGDIYEARFPDGHRIIQVRRWTLIVVRHHVRAAAGAANTGGNGGGDLVELMPLSDDALNELARKFKLSPEYVIAFYKQKRAWYTHNARAEADHFAGAQKPKFTQSMRAIHQGVTWAWNGAKVPALTPQQRIGLISIAIKALGLKDQRCGEPTIKKYIAAIALAEKRATTAAARSRPKKTNPD